MTDARRWFAPVVLLGVAGTGVCALAGAKPWATPDGEAGSTLVDRTGGHVPLAAALGLVGLACWGVFLVTRARARRALAVLGVVVAIGLVSTAVVGRASALDSARQGTVDLDLTPTGAHTTGWWWVALVGAVLALAASALAVRHAAGWPEMGSRYDAPTGPPTTQDPADLEDIDVWRAIDQGRDPTDPGAD
jgi:uncharacterized membrane protein (TIGR02234 family)